MYQACNPASIPPPIFCTASVHSVQFSVLQDHVNLKGQGTHWTRYLHSAQTHAMDNLDDANQPTANAVGLVGNWRTQRKPPKHRVNKCDIIRQHMHMMENRSEAPAEEVWGKGANHYATLPLL